eukprot:363836-Chlamydomonas_euryale.AAC.1
MARSRDAAADVGAGGGAGGSDRSASHPSGSSTVEGCCGERSGTIQAPCQPSMTFTRMPLRAGSGTRGSSLPGRRTNPGTTALRVGWAALGPSDRTVPVVYSGSGREKVPP